MQTRLMSAAIGLLALIVGSVLVSLDVSGGGWITFVGGVLLLLVGLSFRWPFFDSRGR